MPSSSAMQSPVSAHTPAVRRILRESPVALPWATLVIALTEGGWVAIGTALSGLLALANLWALAWLARRAARDVRQGGGGSAITVLVLLVKLPLLVGALWLLVGSFGPLAVAVGAGSILLGAAIGGIRGTTGDES